MALKPLTFLFALVFSASTYLAPIAYAESASPQHRKAGNLEQAVLGNSYLWQHTTNTEYDGFEKEISWQFTFLKNGQTIVHKIHRRGKGGRIIWTSLVHYGWAATSDEVVVQLHWTDADKKNHYGDFHFKLDSENLRAIRSVDHDGSVIVKEAVKPETLNLLVKTANKFDAIFRDWFDGQDERPIYWDQDIYQSDVIATRPKKFVRVSRKRDN